ncbi:hypothetical protein ADICEAN_03717 [Cesiribacter andamanensis AMV16]|uniref:Uncharacterized protein n=1 Tax=Cesiribacter andamanensis AMV16 TaxID=1279009 RepID=M7N1I4_9BACT|nr:hypothetical protein ADICEAN_03717 [Cesiribacter andamanensis AMV16]
MCARIVAVAGRRHNQHPILQGYMPVHIMGNLAIKGSAVGGIDDVGALCGSIQHPLQQVDQETAAVVAGIIFGCMLKGHQFGLVANACHPYSIVGRGRSCACYPGAMRQVGGAAMGIMVARSHTGKVISCKIPAPVVINKAIAIIIQAINGVGLVAVKIVQQVRVGQVHAGIDNGDDDLRAARADLPGLGRLNEGKMPLAGQQGVVGQRVGDGGMHRFGQLHHPGLEQLGGGLLQRQRRIKAQLVVQAHIQP